MTATSTPASTTYLKGLRELLERIEVEQSAQIEAAAAVPLGAAHFMEEHGHIVTGMNNQVVWGMPHVIAIFLIVAASGASGRPKALASSTTPTGWKPSRP